MRLFRGSAFIEGTTSNVSCDGFSVCSPIPFRLEEHLECELVINQPGDGRDPLILRCRARVVRVVESPQQEGAFDVSFRLEDYAVSYPGDGSHR